MMMEIKDILNYLIEGSYHFNYCSYTKKIFDIIHGFDFKMKFIDVVSNYSNDIKIINLKDYEELCPKCKGVGAIKLYELNGDIPINWGCCIYCNGFGKLDFTDIIKKGLK